MFEKGSTVGRRDVEGSVDGKGSYDTDLTDTRTDYGREGITGPKVEKSD